jgi:hypothetical protein
MATEETKAAGERAARGGHPRWAAALVVLGAIVTLLAVFSIWANRQALNTDNWVDTSSRFLADQAIDKQLANYLAQQFAAHSEVKSKLEERLPPKLKPLGGVVATGLRQLAPEIAERALENAKVQGLWRDANRLAHESLLEVLDGGGSTVSTENGEVVLNLRPLVEHLGQEVGVGGKVAEKLPPGAGELTILKSDQLSAAQTGAHIVRELPIVLTLLALVLFGAAVWLSARRRETLRAVGIAFALVGVLVLLARTLGGNVLVDTLVTNPGAEPAAHAAWDIGTSLLKTIAASTLAFGVLVFFAAWIAGPTQVAVGLRRAAAPYVRAHWASAFGGAAVLFLVLIAWRPVAAFGKPLGILVLAVLLAAGAELLRRQILRDFPADGGLAEGGPTRRARS